MTIRKHYHATFAGPSGPVIDNGDGTHTHATMLGPLPDQKGASTTHRHFSATSRMLAGAPIFGATEGKMATVRASARDALYIYTIYDRPRDYPSNVVVRRHVVVNGETTPEATPFAVIGGLFEARAALPPGLTCLGRHPDDEEQIVESWV